MRCPYCHRDDDRVIDSRSTESGAVVRRRRQCNACSKRFTTYERAESETRMVVVKKDGSRMPYDREKIRRGVELACHKRPVTGEQIDALVNQVEEEVFRRFEREVPARFIGQVVCRLLRHVDKVAYIRYASVYHEFRDLGELVSEAQDLMKEPEEVAGQQPLFDEPLLPPGGEK